MKKFVFALILIYATIDLSAQWKPAGNQIYTQWAQTLEPENVLQEYPRPMMEREAWLNLNGLWDYAILPLSAQIPTKYKGKILVPFAVESSLSGVQQSVSENEEIWYKRTFIIPDGWKEQQILLHFGAVDWKMEVYVNDEKVGTHTGGYTPFSFNITPYLKSGEQQLVVKVWDPTNEGFQPRGKQSRKPEGCFYTAVSGIWQTVWLEPVNNKYITAVHSVANIDRNLLTVDVSTKNTNLTDQLEVTVKAENKIIAQDKYPAGASTAIRIPDVRLWSPEQPFLYDIEIKLYDNNRVIDEVKSYAAMRKISVERDILGKMRLQLNNEDYFQCGVMDQGYWPDGLYTAPSDEAMQYDIRKAKDLGFNLIRKHQKVEPARWYAHCDRMGMLVWQDMPAGDFVFSWYVYELQERSSESENNFKKEWKEILDYLKPYPSIVTWILFNESWGQFNTEEMVRLTKSYDPSRLVNPAAGKMQIEEGDLLDFHQYPFPRDIPEDTQRAIVLGEYGGFAYMIPEHSWQFDRILGYFNAQDSEGLSTTYAMTSEILRTLITKGLSAVSYTQLTDIEGEINGLLTYDRRVVKVDEERFREVNERLRNSIQQKNKYKINQDYEAQNFFSTP